MPYADPTSERAIETKRAASRRHYARHREAEIARASAYNKANQGRLNELSAERRATKAPRELVLWRNAKYRARAKGLPFTITVADIIVPERCPVLGIPLVIGRGHARDASPSIDRRDPALGYVPGNIAVLSHKANTMKSNASLAELRRLLAYLEGSNELPPS